MSSHIDERSSSGLRLDAPAYQLRMGCSGERRNQTNRVITYNSDRLDALIHACVERMAGGALWSRHTMTWEWEHRSQGGQWTVTVGGWHAVVQRVGEARVLWQATLTRTTMPQEQHTSPTYPDAVDARTWCLRKIAELAGKTA